MVITFVTAIATLNSYTKYNDLFTSITWGQSTVHVFTVSLTPQKIVFTLILCLHILLYVGDLSSAKSFHLYPIFNP